MTTWKRKWGGEPEGYPPPVVGAKSDERTLPQSGMETFLTEMTPTDSLCQQIGDALDGHALAPLAKKAGVSVNTLVRAKAGEGIRLETLEKVARALGWTVIVLNRDNQTLVHAKGLLPDTGQ